MLPVVIIAGGLATRMYPLTKETPKSLIKILGKPFIYHQLMLLKRNGIDSVIVCLGHLGWMIEEYLALNDFPINIRFSYDGETPIGTGGAVFKATQGLESPFFVLYGDSYLDIGYQEIEEAYKKCKQQCLMTVFRNNGLLDKSNVEYNNGRIIIYSKSKPSSNMEHIDFGLSILTHSNLVEHGSDKAFDLANVFERLSVDGNLYGYEVFNRFYEVGSQEGLIDLERYLNKAESNE